MLQLVKNTLSVCFQCLPLTDQLNCPIEAAQAAGRSVGHRYRGAGVCPGHGNPHSCASQSNFDPSERQQKYMSVTSKETETDNTS